MKVTRLSGYNIFLKEKSDELKLKHGNHKLPYEIMKLVADEWASLPDDLPYPQCGKNIYKMTSECLCTV